MSRAISHILFLLLTLELDFIWCRPDCNPRTDGVCWGAERCDGAVGIWSVSGNTDRDCCFDSQCNMPHLNDGPMHHICEAYTGRCRSTSIPKDVYMMAAMRRAQGDADAGEIDHVAGIMIKNEDVELTPNELNPTVAAAEESIRRYEQHNQPYYTAADNYKNSQNNHYFNEPHGDYLGDDGVWYSTNADYLAADANDISDVINFGLPNFLSFLRGKKK